MDIRNSPEGFAEKILRLMVLVGDLGLGVAGLGHMG